VVAVGVAAQSAAELLDVSGSVGLGLVYVSYALLTAFALRNLRLVGMPVVLLGLVLNVAVIGVNGGMPVRAEALRAAGHLTDAEIAALDFGAKRHLEDGGDRLTILGDVIPVRPTREVLSFGDIVLAFGIADVLFRLLRPVGLGRGQPDTTEESEEPASDPVVRMGPAG
jgi:hypothetical protein